MDHTSSLTCASIPAAAFYRARLDKQRHDDDEMGSRQPTGLIATNHALYQQLTNNCDDQTPTMTTTTRTSTPRDCCTTSTTRQCRRTPARSSNFSRLFIGTNNHNDNNNNNNNQSTTTRRHLRTQNNFTICLALVALALLMVAQTTTTLTEAASANRVNMHQVSRQTNQYFLNEFCDLESKTLRSAKKLKQASDTHSLFLTSKQTLSSVRVLPQKQQMPSSISFGLGSSAPASQAAPVLKQLNCSIIVVAPKLHGLLVTVNSIGFPKNLTKLGITLNHDSPHAQHIHLGGENTSANYLLTQPQSSKIAINLQSFKPIDWSHVSFDILFTVYKKANSTGCPTKKWFDCGDNICVPSSLVCDNNRNCPNGNDEMIFYACYSPLFWSIAASCALALILIAIMIVVIMIVRNQRRRRGLTKLNSFSNHQLAADTGDEHNSSSKLDLTQAEQLANSRGLTLGGGPATGSYLASNMYLGGFENPVWTNGTLPKGASQHQQQRQDSPLPSAPAATSSQQAFFK